MKRILNKIDKPLFIVMLLSLIFGVIMVGSASSLKAYMTTGDNYFYFNKQLLFTILSLCAYFVVILIPIKKYRKFIFIFLLGVLGALIYVLISDKIMNGIKGWIYIGSFGIQPSEFAKTILILFFALAFENMMKYDKVSNVIKLLPFAISLIILVLVFLQPDLGTMIILLGIICIIFCLVPFDGKTKLVCVIFTLTFGLILASVMLITGKGLSSSQKNRLNFTKPCTRYREDTGYQVCNGYIAINSGGILGSGIGNSKQKYLYLPEAHTDFIFAIIIEETGLVAGLAIIIAYFIIIWRIIMIGKKSYNLQGAIICYGVATYIGLHILINLGGVLGLIPLTGVPLPFYSYGGSFMLNLLICLGLVQRVTVESRIFEQKHLVR